MYSRLFIPGWALWINCNLLCNGQHLYVERGCILFWKDLYWLYINDCKYECLYWNTAYKSFVNSPQNFSFFPVVPSYKSIKNGSGRNSKCTCIFAFNMQFYYSQCHLLCFGVFQYLKMQFSVNCTNGDVSVNTFF